MSNVLELTGNSQIDEFLVEHGFADEAPFPNQYPYQSYHAPADTIDPNLLNIFTTTTAPAEQQLFDNTYSESHDTLPTIASSASSVFNAPMSQYTATETSNVVDKLDQILNIVGLEGIFPHRRLIRITDPNFAQLLQPIFTVAKTLAVFAADLNLAGADRMDVLRILYDIAKKAWQIVQTAYHAAKPNKDLEPNTLGPLHSKVIQSWTVDEMLEYFASNLSFVHSQLKAYGFSPTNVNTNEALWRELTQAGDHWDFLHRMEDIDYTANPTAPRVHFRGSIITKSFIDFMYLREDSLFREYIDTIRKYPALEILIKGVAWNYSAPMTAYKLHAVAFRAQIRSSRRLFRVEDGGNSHFLPHDADNFDNLANYLARYPDADSFMTDYLVNIAEFASELAMTSDCVRWRAKKALEGVL